jgi:hypothetical protein
MRQWSAAFAWIAAHRSLAAAARARALLLVVCLRRGWQRAKADEADPGLVDP